MLNLNKQQKSSRKNPELFYILIGDIILRSMMNGQMIHP